jgi:hypothetical protein
MRCFVQILHIEDGRATVEIADGLNSGEPGRKHSDDLFDLPLSVLPENSRAGDILQLQASFCPFKTLTGLE